MEKQQNGMAERILNLTLEVICLLTGEECIIAKKPSNGHMTHGSQSWSKKQSPMKELPASSQISQTINKKILEITWKIIELLTGEVPIRCQDVTVYFSMEEWEYLEGHKDLYKDVMMEKRPPLTSPDGSKKRNPPETCPGPLYSQDSTQDQEIRQEYHEILQARPLNPHDPTEEHHQNLQARPLYTTYSEQEHHAMPETHPLYSRDCTQEYHKILHTQPLKSWDSTQEHHEIHKNDQASSEEHKVPQNDQVTLELKEGNCKTEIKEEPEESYVTCKEEERSPGISTDPGDIRATQIHVRAEKEEEEHAWIKEEEEGHVRIKEEEIPPEIGTDPGGTRDTKSKDEEEELVRIKEEEMFTEIRDAVIAKQALQLKDSDCNTKIREEPYVRHDEPCKEEEHSPQISTGGHQIRNNKEKCSSNFPANINCTMFSSPGEEPNNPNLHPALFKADQLSYTSTPGGVFPNHTPLITYPTGREKFLCYMCGKSFTRKESLTLHQRSHRGEKPHSCSVCGKRFLRRWCLINHERTHTGEKPYSCTECGKHFSHKSNVVSHKRGNACIPPTDPHSPYSCSRKENTAQRTHCGKRIFLCSECGKCFSQSSALVKHKRTHTGERPFCCSQCGKCFTQTSHLNIHERIHSGEKPYSCEDCGKCFIGRSGLTEHRKTHTGEKPYSCLVCGKRFTRNASLVIHQNIHTRKKP